MKRLSYLGIVILLLSGCNENVSTKTDPFPIEGITANIEVFETSIHTLVEHVKQTTKEKEEVARAEKEKEKKNGSSEVATTTTAKPSHPNESKTASSNGSQTTSKNSSQSTTKSTSKTTPKKSTTTSQSTQSSMNPKTDSSTKKDNDTASKKDEKPYIVRGSVRNSGKTFKTKDEALDYGTSEVLNPQSKWYGYGFEGYTIEYSDGTYLWTVNFYEAED